ncbi:MAG: hypothetical protein OER95_09095 [Acidimicrobiia bacterium]|nr:hypothetical protein [Acidimicrobiia bacterium]
MANRFAGDLRSIVIPALLAGALALSACTSGDESTPPTTTTDSATSSPTEAPPIGGSLRTDFFNDGVYCDGTMRPAVFIFEATPGETLRFTSPMPVEIPDGVTDDRGAYQLDWSCQANEASLSWEVTAIGLTSNRIATFLINGSYENPDTDRSLTFTPSEDGLVCDGTSQVIGRLDNAEPDEAVTFTASTGQSLRTGVADGLGSLVVNWECDAGEATRIWNIRAEGQESGRLAAFTVQGRPPRRPSGPVQVELIENPFTCDRGRRPIATLTNLTPQAEVSFDAVPSNGRLQPGRADSNGTLDVYWQCQRGDAGTTWELTVVEDGGASSAGNGRSVSFTFSGAASDATVTIAITEDPFVCDGDSRQFALLSGFVSREFVAFSSPQSGSLREGQADENGELPVRWQCTADQADTVWEVTATGRTSELTLTFPITGTTP